MKSGGVGQRFLDYTGFTSLINFSRVISAGAGRLWFEQYAYPELVKNPGDKDLRRKLSDLYGMSDEQLDKIAKNGYGPDDVRRMELGAANWTTGSNRPSEMPPAFRPGQECESYRAPPGNDPAHDAIASRLMFKTANLVHCAVFERLQIRLEESRAVPPDRAICPECRFAGFALEQILSLRHQMTGSSEAELRSGATSGWSSTQLRQKLCGGRWPISRWLLVSSLRPELFNEMATHEPKDKQKLNQQHRSRAPRWA